MKVLLTGSSKGIGYKIAQDLLTEGHEVALHYNKNEFPLKALLNQDKTGSFSIQADLSIQEEIKKMIAKTIDKFRITDHISTVEKCKIQLKCSQIPENEIKGINHKFQIFLGMGIHYL